MEAPGEADGGRRLVGILMSGSLRSKMAARPSALGQVLLVVFLRPVERSGPGDLGDDRPAELAAGIESLPGGRGGGLLLLVVEEDGRSVLRADVRPLAVQGRRVVRF